MDTARSNQCRMVALQTTPLTCRFAISFVELNASRFVQIRLPVGTVPSDLQELSGRQPTQGSRLDSRGLTFRSYLADIPPGVTGRCHGRSR